MSMLPAFGRARLSPRGTGRTVLEAEPEHQDYLEKYPDGYTCHFIRPEWTLPHRQEAGRKMAG